MSYNEMFDCGASSGYGSPSLIGTPLASPAPNSTPYQLHKMLLDQGFCENAILAQQQISPRNRLSILQNTTHNAQDLSLIKNTSLLADSLTNSLIIENDCNRKSNMGSISAIGSGFTNSIMNEKVCKILIYIFLVKLQKNVFFKKTK